MGDGADSKVSGSDNGRDPGYAARRQAADELLYKDIGLTDRQGTERPSDFLGHNGRTSKGWADKGWADKGWSTSGPSELIFSDAVRSESDLFRLPTPEVMSILKKISTAESDASAPPQLPEARHGAIQSKDGVLAPLKAFQIPGEITKVLSNIDRNGDGKIDFDELGRSVQNSDYTGKTAQALAALYAARDKVAGADRTIIRENLSKLAELQDLSKLLPTFDTVSAIGKSLLKSRLFPPGEDITKESLLQRSQAKDLTPAEKLLLTQAVNSFDDLTQLSGSNNNRLTAEGLRKASGFSQ